MRTMMSTVIAEEGGSVQFCNDNIRAPLARIHEFGDVFRCATAMPIS
jgi:hypothetical protein